MGAQTGANGASNHVLHDYQVQLMLLEQQNKGNLMMARQEADHHPGGQPMPGQAGLPLNMEGRLYVPFGLEGRPFMETLSDWSTEYVSEDFVNQSQEA